MRQHLITILISLPILLSSTKAQSEQVVSFGTAKKKLYSKVFNNTGETFYCGCDWSNRKTGLASCGLQSFFPKSQRKRAARTEAEHIIPASWMLKVNKQYRQCAVDAKKYGESPRDYCQKKDRNYKQAHNDLVNLVPAVGQINGDRSNKPYVASVKPSAKSYGQCDILIDSRGIIPPKDKQGDIARIAFYMQSKYNVTYSPRQMALFEKWDKVDPISVEERARNRKIIKVQGYGLKQ